MKTLLITGGLGFIGSHTVVQLLKTKNFHVVVIDNLRNSSKEVIQNIIDLGGASFDFFEADLKNFDDLDRIFSKFEIFGVIHFAALKAVGESVKKSLEYYENNVSGTITLLKAMKKHNIRNMIFSSSATVYGFATCPPEGFDELTPITFPSSSPYGTSKIIMERILIDHCESEKDFCAILLRYFNPIGAHPSGKIGENINSGSANLVPILLQVLLGQRKELTVFGKDYPSKDGTAVRDYLHVMDLAEGHVAALKCFEKAGVQIFNLGSGKGVTVLEVISAMEKATGKKIPYVFGPRREGDQITTISNPQKANKELDWKCSFSVEEACLHSWNFVKSK